MKAQSFVTFTLVLLVLFVPVVSDSIMIALESDITTFVEGSDIVVYGWVMKKEFVLWHGECTTHITIDVIEMIKGKPGYGGNRVKFTVPGGECGGSIDWVEDTPDFEVGEAVFLFLSEYPNGGYHVFRFNEGKRPVQGLKVPIEYTHRGRKVIHLPIDVAIQIAKAAVKHPKATRQLEEEIKAHIRYSEMFTDTLKVKAKIIQNAAPPPTAEERAIELSNTITGLDKLADVRITASAFTLPEDDDTPILLIKKRLVDSKHLWKVSYQVDGLKHKNIANPHIKGFDVYVDTAQGQVLKIVSRDAEGLPEEFRKGIEVSNQQVCSAFGDNPLIAWDLPTVTPTYTLGDFLTGKGKIYRHYECYYILYREPDGDKRDKVFPIWLVILYGTEPIEPLKPRTLADGYVRTFEIYFVNAISGEGFPFVHITGENTDTFR